MKTLSEFNTLAEAQAYEVITGQMIHRDSMNGWLGQAGIYKAMKTIAADEANPFSDLMEAFLDSEEYNFKQGTTTGDEHIALLDSLIANEPTIGAALGNVKPIVMARANVVSKPYEFATQAEFDEAKDAGETIALPANNNQHTATISITTQPLKPVNIVVEQRFSKDGTDWTEWHSVGAFRNVDYPQRNYEASVPKSPAAFRELRAVSPLTLGVSLPVYPVSQEI